MLSKSMKLCLDCEYVTVMDEKMQKVIIKQKYQDIDEVVVYPFSIIFPF